MKSILFICDKKIMSKKTEIIYDDFVQDKLPLLSIPFHVKGTALSMQHCIVCQGTVLLKHLRKT